MERASLVRISSLRTYPLPITLNTHEEHLFQIYFPLHGSYFPRMRKCGTEGNTVQALGEQVFKARDTEGQELRETEGSGGNRWSLMPLSSSSQQRAG